MYLKMTTMWKTVCMSLYWITVLTVRSESEVVLEGRFIASNAIQVSVCIFHKHHQTIESMTFTLENNQGVVTHYQHKVNKTQRQDQNCESNTLWFDIENMYYDNLTVEAYVVVSNSSMRRGLITLERKAHHPPMVKQVHVTRNEESFKTIPGPFYDQTVPSVIPMFVPVDPEDNYPDEFKLVCEVEGHPKPSVAWYRNGVRVDGDTHLAKTVGLYTCQTHNQYGTSLSHVIHLKKAFIGTIPQRDNPAEVTVDVGDGRELQCESKPPCFPDCQVFWYKSKNPEDKRMRIKDIVSIDNHNTFVNGEGSLIFTSVHVNDAGMYRCEVEEEDVLQETMLGTTIKLSVNGREDNILPSSEPKLVYKSDNTIIAIDGESQKLYCLFNGRPEPEVYWYKDSVLLPNVTNILEFNNINPGHAGVYSCMGKTNFGQSEKYTISIRVESKPVINNNHGLQPVVAVKGGNITIRCNTSGIPVPGVSMIWNNTKGSNANKYSLLKHDVLRITNVTMDDIGIISCNASNYVGSSYSTTFINVTEPTIITSKFQDIYIDSNTSITVLHFVCEAETDPNTVLSVLWYKEGKVIKTNKKIGITVNRSLLEIHMKDIEKIYGKYVCEASNNISSTRESFHIFPLRYIAADGVIDPAEKSFAQATLIVFIGSILLGLILVILVVIIIKQKCRHTKEMETRSRTYSTHSDRTVTSSIPPMSETEQLFGSIIIENQLPLIKDYREDMLPVRDPALRSTVCEVYIDRQRILMNDLIGKGQFGRVYAAILTSEKGTDGNRVAVKTLKYKADETEIVDCFLHEAVIMKNFTHPHVLSLTGISFELDGSPMVVLPYMSNGDLRNYIQDPAKDITVLELLKLGLQVARGMMYLSLRKYVHRDLACRNCMVDNTNTVKVADFGLSRYLFSRDYYREACGKRPLPVRWMAPECHHSNLFTMQSDVWSFGILLWELMTRGAVPYPNVENWNVSAHVVAGNKLPQPNYCPTSVYRLMLSCWEIKASQRTPFHQLVHDIEDIVHSADMGTEESESFYINVQRNEEPDYRMSNNSGSGMTIL